jgi:hypothetical protein
VARRVAFLTSRPAGLSLACAEGSGGRQARCSLVEQWLRIFEMHEEADPVALAQSRLLPDPLPQEYAATRVRRAVYLKAIRNDDVALWSFFMLPYGPLVSGFPPLFSLLIRGGVVVTQSFTRPLQVTAVDATRSDPPTPRARARARTAQRREQESAARKKEKRIRRRERREQRDEEFRLREQQGLSPLTTLEDSSSGEEEEESDGGQALPNRWEPSPHSPRATEAAEVIAHGAGAGTPAARQPTREATRTAEAPARHGDDWGCGGGHAGGHNVHRAPEEEEAGILHPEVGDRSPVRRIFDMSESLTFSFSRSQGGAHCALQASAKVLRSDTAVPSRRRSSRASRAAGSTAMAESRGSRGTTAATESQQVVTATEPLRAATARSHSRWRRPRSCGSGATADSDGHDSNHGRGGCCSVDFAGARHCLQPSSNSGGGPGRRRPAARLGPVGEPACVSPRGLSGSAHGEGRRRCGARVPGWRCRGLVVTRCSPNFGWPRGVSRAGAGACRRAASPLR